jgi:glutamyl-Q tRNA(Asp) synthetase
MVPVMSVFGPQFGSSQQPVFRFAPSPNGRLHLGHVRSALVGYRLAQRINGRFLVRIEDIDTARCRTEYIASIFDDLNWLGVSWETPVRQQSKHFDDYRRAADQLLAADLLYPCFATRQEIAIVSDPGRCDPDGVPLYPGRGKCIPDAETKRRQRRGEPFSLRLDIQRALARASNLMNSQGINDKSITFAECSSEDTSLARARLIAARPERWGDAVIVRKDTPTSYHLSVVVDDALQGITHVTRGRDLFAATDLHRLLQVLLGLPQPLYHHHAVIIGPDGRKLSKSAGAPSLYSLRAKGITLEDVLRMT